MRPMLVLSCLCLSVFAQGFGPQQVITNNATWATSVYAIDLDGDGDADVLSSSEIDDKIAWYENQGGGAFGPQQVISTSATGAQCVYATDLDGDGDADVLSANQFSSTIAWYENQGINTGTFGPLQVITTNALVPFSVYATDLDGDGDADVLVGSIYSPAPPYQGQVTWYENLGINTGTFGVQQVIATSAIDPFDVFATDLDGDGDADVLSASTTDDKIAWYENLGINTGTFGAEQVITTNADGAYSVYATDLDGDGDADVMSASYFDDKIAWYENLGVNTGTFGVERAITTNADGARSVYAADLDNDGDADVLSGSAIDNKIAWFENLGGGTFGAEQVITTSVRKLWSTYATDLDGDGDPDVLSASYGNDEIAWFENYFCHPLPVPPCPSGACLHFSGTPMTGGSVALTLQTPLPNATCFVFASRTLHPNPAGYQVTFMGMTYTFQLQFWGPDVIAFADPAHTFGQSLSDPTTDSYGDWCYPFAIPNDPSLVGVTYHGEAFVTNGVTHYDSNLVTIQIQ